MKKKIFAGMLIVLFGMSGVAMAFSPITIFVNGKQAISDVAPFSKDGRTMVPLRTIAENLGADVKWNEKTQSVQISNRQKDYNLQLLNNLQFELLAVLQADMLITNAFDNKTDPGKNLTSALGFIKASEDRQSQLNSFKSYVSDPSILGYSDSLITIRNSVKATATSLKGNLPFEKPGIDYSIAEAGVTATYNNLTALNKLSGSICNEVLKQTTPK